MYDIGTELQYHQAKVSFADPFSAKDTLAWLVPYESQSDITPDTIQQNQTSSAWVCFGVRDNGMIVDKNHNLFDIGIWLDVTSRFSDWKHSFPVFSTVRLCSVMKDMGKLASGKSQLWSPVILSLSVHNTT